MPSTIGKNTQKLWSLAMRNAVSFRKKQLCKLEATRRRYNTVYIQSDGGQKFYNKQEKWKGWIQVTACVEGSVELSPGRAVGFGLTKGKRHQKHKQYLRRMMLWSIWGLSSLKQLLSCIQILLPPQLWNLATPQNLLCHYCFLPGLWLLSLTWSPFVSSDTSDSFSTDRMIFLEQEPVIFLDWLKPSHGFPFLSRQRSMQLAWSYKAHEDSASAYLTSPFLIICVPATLPLFHLVPPATGPWYVLFPLLETLYPVPNPTQFIYQHTSHLLKEVFPGQSYQMPLLHRLIALCSSPLKLFPMFCNYRLISLIG